MNFQNNNEIQYLHYPETPLREVVHGFFTRQGGVSSYPYHSLNLSISTGDTRENVRRNRDIIFESVQRQPETMFDVWQVHSDTVVCTSQSRNMEETPQKADAIFTDNPDITLLMRFADCVPILIYDPVRKVVGIIHAGWLGTVKRIASKAIDVIVERYHSQPGDIYAVIGPSIRPEHYQVGDDVYQIAAEIFESENAILARTGDKLYTFDLPKANELILQQTGVKNIIQSNICTACDTTLWYSHRAEKGKTGRFAAIIGLK